MTRQDFIALLPFLALLGAAVLVMLVIAVRRDHRLTLLLTLAGLAAAAALLPAAAGQAPRGITPLIVVDLYALYYTGLVVLASLAVAGLSYSYLEMHKLYREEFYLLLITACLGASVLASSSHFMSFFLALEILSVSLYALTAYQRHSQASTEAGIKYLILAAISSAFILFGMALVYAATGTMSFAEITPRHGGLLASAGMVLILAGLGFKLAVVPFHFWTPDVYEGAPAPVAAFIATVSKGAVFALALRLFDTLSQPGSGLFVIFTAVAVLSMFAGNLLALFQQNVKRILAYSSISHMGYLLVTLLVAGQLRWSASAFYLAAYFITSLGAFGVVTVLSTSERDADRLEDYTGLAWRRPWLAGTLTVMLLSLAGIPLTAGFVAKFYLVAAGVGARLWLLVFILVINSALGLFYYLRIIAAVYARPEGVPREPATGSMAGSAVLTCLCLALVWLGVYPGPMLSLIQRVVQGLR